LNESIIVKDDDGEDIDITEILDDMENDMVENDETIKPSRGGLIKFRSELKKNKIATKELIESYMRGMDAHDRAIVHEAMEELSRQSQHLSDYEKKLIALDTASFVRAKELKLELLNTALGSEAMTREQILALEVKTRLLDTLERKEGLMMRHIANSRASNDSNSAIRKILENSEIVVIKRKVRSRSEGTTYEGEYKELEE